MIGAMKSIDQLERAQTLADIGKCPVIGYLATNVKVVQYFNRLS